MSEQEKTTPTTEERTFTQEQVNAFVQERLTREKAKHETAMAELEARATLAERRLIAQRYDVPVDKQEKYLKLAELYPNDDGDFEKSLATALSEFPLPKQAIPRIVAGMSTSIQQEHDPIREGMGLHKKE